MPNPAAAPYKNLGYKAESTFGTAPGQAGGQLLRRVQSNLSLAKDTYSSNEIRTDFQRSDFRHGVRRVQGQISGELSAGTYKDFFAAALKKDFVAGVSASALGLTIAGSGPTYTVTRGSGSYLTDGFKVGDVVRLSVGSLNAANINKNLQIVAIGSATVITVRPLNGVAMVAEGPVTGCTVAVQGKKTYVPLTGHTDKSFAFEDWHTDLAQSELYLGCKVTKLALGLQPTGIITCALDVLGQDLAETSTKRGGIATSAQYYTSPTALTSSSVLAAVNGLVASAGSGIASLTGLSLEVNSPYAGNPVVGSNVVPFLFAAPVTVSGQFSAYFDGVTFRDAFINETEIDLIGAFTADNTATAAFIAFALHRLKLTSATKSDAADGIVLTCGFEALLNSAGGTGIATEATTIAFQDSAA